MPNTKLHTCQVDDICGNTHILRGYSLDELLGQVGPQWPILLDGVPGKLTGTRDDVRFVPAN